MGGKRKSLSNIKNYIISHGSGGAAKVAFINHLVGAPRKMYAPAFVMMSVNPRSSLLID